MMLRTAELLQLPYLRTTLVLILAHRVIQSSLSLRCLGHLRNKAASTRGGLHKVTRVPTLSKELAVSQGLHTWKSSDT